MLLLEEEFDAGFGGATHASADVRTAAARTGAYGGQTRRTYDILGDQVNLAARLMMAAKPGEILVSRRIQEQVQGDFELTSLAPIAVKGKSQPVAIARLEARKLGIFSRPLGNTVEVFPPLSLTPDELELLLDGLEQAIIKVVEE